MRVLSKPGALALGSAAAASLVWLIYRGLRLGHVLVQFPPGGQQDMSGIVTHVYVMRSVATPVLYWGSVGALVAALLAALVFLLCVIRS